MRGDDRLGTRLNPLNDEGIAEVPTQINDRGKEIDTLELLGWDSLDEHPVDLDGVEWEVRCWRLL